ncbi:MAG: M20 metallopeptidase family protein [Spirochaetia bacterium]
MIPAEELRKRAARVLPKIVELRHALHRIPEMHFQERETAAAIRAFLAGTSLEILPPLLETDTIGLLRGGTDGPCILLRADMDALPVQERSGAAWSSERPGRAHSCGHDGHMAILAGAACLLDTFSRELAGSVRFVFQPAEEEAAGGKVLIDKGLLEIAPRPAAVFALHGWPGLPVGCLSSAAGPAMAEADTFLITVRGKGGHAGLPHQANDPVLAAARVVTALQSVVSRSMDPQDSVVLSICRIEGGKASNVIPDEVALEGTTRYFDRSLQGTLRDRIRRTVEGTCAAAGCTAELAYEEGYVPLVNHQSGVDLARSVVTSCLGSASWISAHPRSMTAEDFAFYLERVPGAYLRLGLGEEWPPLHAAVFDFNDRSLEPGIVTMAGLALELCGR